MIAMTPSNETRIIELLEAVVDELRRSNSPPPELMTQSEVADFLRVDERTVRTWTHEGLVPPPITIRKEKRWRKADIQAWIKAKKP